MLNRLMAGILVGLGGLSWLQSTPAEAQDQPAAEHSKKLVNFVAQQIVNFGGQNAQIFAGLRAYPERRALGPDWGLRAGITFLFPTQ